MKYNMNFIDIILRYYLMMFIVIFTGFTGLWWLTPLALPVFLSAIFGWSPIYSMLGINNHDLESPETIKAKKVVMDQKKR